MNSLRVGLVVAVLGAALMLAALFGTALWAMAPSPMRQDPPAEEIETVEASAEQQTQIIVTATVGTVQGECATTRRVYVLPNTPVYYCFRVYHTGASGVPDLITHYVETSRGTKRDLPPPGQTLRLEPRREINTVGANLVFTDVAGVEDTTTYITWTARPEDGQTQYTATSQVVIDVVRPDIEVTKSVGQGITSCPAARNLRVPSGQAVSFCIRLQNTGDITFTRHIITDELQSIINTSFNYTLAPGATLDILPSNLRQLGINNGTLDRANVTAPFANSVTIQSFTANNLTASGASTATVDIGTTTVRMTKTVSTEPENCSGDSTIQVPPGTRVYYCVLLQNTGEVTLTDHQFTETHLSIDVRF